METRSKGKGEKRKVTDAEIDVEIDDPAASIPEMGAPAVSTREAKRTKKDGGAWDPAGWFAVYYEYPDGTAKAHEEAFELLPKHFVNCEEMRDVANILKEETDAFEHVKRMDMRFSRGAHSKLGLKNFMDELSRSDPTSPVRIYCRAPAGPVPAVTPSRDLDQRYNKFAPSAMNPRNVKEVQTRRRSQGGPLYRCGRPVGVEGLEAPLMHPVFGTFMENLRNPSPPTRADCAYVQEFCSKSSDFHDTERERQGALTVLLRSYLKRAVGHRKIISFEVDGYIGNPKGFPVYLIVEVENELGSTPTDKFFQGQRFYREFCAQARKESPDIFRSCNCPTFLVELRGAQMRVSAMAYFDRVHASMLTDLVSTSWPSESLPHIFKALKRGIDGLESFYQQVLDEGTTSTRESWLEKVTPHPLWWKPRYILQGDLKSIGQHVYLAEDHQKRMVVIKFTRRYGDEVHKAWDTAGYAPQFLEIEELGGGFKMIVMEYLGRPWQMLADLDTETKNRARMVVGEALQKVHKLDVFDAPNPGSVHGDVRGVNIMVRSRGEGFDVRFIDFDWAGQEGVSRYPSNMNHTSIRWPQGVADGEPMLQSHDTDVLNSRNIDRGADFGYDWVREV